MDKNTGRGLPEWLQRHLPDDPVIAWDIATKISQETQGENTRSVIGKGDRDEGLNEKQDEVDAAVSKPYPFILLLLLAVLSMVAGAVYAVLRWEALL
ncbi:MULTISPECIES: hypothetical protein [unclassified Mesorhizobium]|uniref:hypothetical protein n=1 Tax=unclassified Mesorhizobium TaxID=325217 RepID=UPI000FE55019|nr:MULTISPECIES: hypothetical protein [unclassified Mesorhizobium]RWI27805.1 MAG: hypothetical protein EOQ92_11815 [Mesorhizobium sp.]RWK49447.1 MAG: hypothetical protein EOR47_14320 [Mesorhizobium sp.]RWK94813.1 MAG: hypothetical protein EOR53_16720 [Mesorhizobium sp.]RWL08482.1 MAG: hypothetical protein EOR45_09985 [Mesorhizobium sp.]TIP59207.1 MAG: hypothetical protein E5X56_11565 [Mesorhizobium sp.]